MKKLMNLFFGIVLLIGVLSFISAVSITSVISTPSEVAPGEIVDLVIKLENTLENDIVNFRIKLDLANVPFAPYESSSEKFIDEISEGDKESFKFRLITVSSTPSGVYKIPVIISYKENETYEQTETISLIVNSEPEVKILLDDTTGLIKGMKNELSVKIINSGLSDIKFAYLTVNNPAKIQFFSERESYIGDIDSDDFDSVDYNIFVSPDASSSIKFSVTLTFKDSANQLFTETEDLTLKTYSVKEAQSLGLINKPNYTIYIISVFGIIGFIIYRIRKKRKKRKKQ